MTTLVQHSERLRRALIRLAGQQPPLPTPIPERAVQRLLCAGDGLGYSQLNELLILMGFDRVTHSFFQYLVNGELDYVRGAEIGTFEELDAGIERFRQVALLVYGNVKFAFKLLSGNSNVLRQEVTRHTSVEEEHFKLRHEQILPIDPIPGHETYYLGYIIERELNQRVVAGDAQAIREDQRRKALVEQGKRNHEAYLTSDHLDVYIATSMRERHEFVNTHELVEKIFEPLSELKLRWFDPTQAYCANRVDKGIAEALMLRRAHCTIYLAQEADTLGKDSELASTLAQGKAVIAYVPTVSDNFTTDLIRRIHESYPNKTVREVIMEQLRLFSPAAAWTNQEVMSWLRDATQFDEASARALLDRSIRDHYEKRAQTLKESHPLGIQVHLETGVANGVLVVREPWQCAELVRRIVTRRLEFTVSDEDGMVVLREKISDCIYRVMTADAMLTNSFWNFYLDRS